MFSNEEDIKNKYIVPYLKILGFHESELFFEKSFDLKVGRYTYRIDTNKQIRTAQPRLDILVKRDNQNLCIVEVKDVSVTIGPDEIDQAVSYGRLVHPIAPICIITNGKDWTIVDTITKEKIAEDNKLSEALNYNISLPQQAYYEALQHFLGYSQGNVLTFCQQQVNNYMEPLKGSKDDRDKKYIEELYQVRKKVAKLFDTFALSNSICFVEIGDSGSGKSCWICHSALTYLNQGFATFFYRGSDVEEGIFNAISEDLNWSFSPQYDEIQGIKRLLEVFHQSAVLIFVDGLDEISLHTARKILTQFVRRAEGTKAKLIATCKTDTWEKLLEYDSVPTSLALKVFQTDGGKGYRLSQYFDLYRRMPLNLMVAVECENEPLPLINYPHVTVLTYTDRSQAQNTVLLSSREEIKRKKDEIRLDPEHYPIFEENYPLFLNAESHMPLEVDKRRCVLRNLIYKSIKEDLKSAFFKFAAKYGVEINNPHKLF